MVLAGRLRSLVSGNWLKERSREGKGEEKEDALMGAYGFGCCDVRGGGAAASEEVEGARCAGCGSWGEDEEDIVGAIVVVVVGSGIGLGR